MVRTLVPQLRARGGAKLGVHSWKEPVQCLLAVYTAQVAQDPRDRVRFERHQAPFFAVTDDSTGATSLYAQSNSVQNDFKRSNVVNRPPAR
jgi:hypothetical protein